MAKFTDDNFHLTQTDITRSAEGIVRNYGNDAAHQCGLLISKLEKTSAKGAETWSRIQSAVVASERERSANARDKVLA